MSEIKITERLKKQLIKAGMVEEIPILDIEVAAALRGAGFRFQKTLPEFKRVQWYLGKDEKKPKAIVSYTPGEIKAVPEQISIIENHKGKISFRIYYKIQGLIGPDLKAIKAIKKVKTLLYVKSKVVRL